MDADEHSDDGSRVRRCMPFVPCEAWIEAFDAQCNQRMVKRLQRFAGAWARIVGGEGAGNHTHYAEELVQNALTDTLAGVLRWDPNTHDLEPHLMDVIRLRARRDRKRAQRHEYVTVDPSTLDDPCSSLEHVEASLAATSSREIIESTETAATAMARAMTQLRALAADDLLAQRFLDAAEGDATTRAEIMRAAGLTRDQYHNTRRRLARLVAQIESSPDLSARRTDHETT